MTCTCVPTLGKVPPPMAITIGWTKRSCHLVRCHESECWGVLLQIGPSTITTIFSPETREVLVSPQDEAYCRMVKRYVIHISASPFRDLLLHITHFYHYDLMPPKKFFTHKTQLSWASQKYFQSGPALAKAVPVHVCVFTIKLCHEFAFNLSRKFLEIICLTISGYYPANRLAKIQILGYICYPNSKNYWY